MKFLSWPLLVVGFSFLPGFARADLFKFKDGRVVHGDVVSSGTEKIGDVETLVFSVEIDAGVYVQIFESELAVNGHEPLSQPRLAYEKLVPAQPKTIEAQLKLVRTVAGREFQLTDVVKALREYCVDLAPNESTVRIGAGYQQDSNGRWKKKDEIMIQQRGLVHDGRGWRLPEDISMEREEEKRNKQVVAATKELVRWHSIVTNRYSKPDSRAYREALQGIRSIQDPLATDKMIGYLQDKKLSVPMRLMYVELLARLANPAAAGAIAQAAMEDPSDQVRNACLDIVRDKGRQLAISIFVGYLSSPSNAQINQAGNALAQLNASEAVLPLINVLVTEHKVVEGSGRTEASSAGGFQTGSKESIVKFENVEVRGALSTITGQTFGYDRETWLQWFAQQYAAPAGDLRRDQ